MAAISGVYFHTSPRMQRNLYDRTHPIRDWQGQDWTLVSTAGRNSGHHKSIDIVVTQLAEQLGRRVH